jgi:hypothetical protein
MYGVKGLVYNFELYAGKEIHMTENVLALVILERLCSAWPKLFPLARIAKYVMAVGIVAFCLRPH